MEEQNITTGDVETVKLNQDGTPRKKRNTMEEQKQALLARIAEIEAKQNGTYVDSNPNKALSKRLTATKRELFSARQNVDGIGKKDGKGWTRKPIAERIVDAENRLASLIETKARSEEFIARLPFDVDLLTKTIAAGEAGETVEMPSDLFPLQRPENRTTEQHETNALATADEN